MRGAAARPRQGGSARAQRWGSGQGLGGGAAAVFWQVVAGSGGDSRGKLRPQWGKGTGGQGWLGRKRRPGGRVWFPGLLPLTLALLPLSRGARVPLPSRAGCVRPFIRPPRTGFGSAGGSFIRRGAGCGQEARAPGGAGGEGRSDSAKVGHRLARGRGGRGGYGTATADGPQGHLRLLPFLAARGGPPSSCRWGSGRLRMVASQALPVPRP